MVRVVRLVGWELTEGAWGCSQSTNSGWREEVAGDGEGELQGVAEL